MAFVVDPRMCLRTGKEIGAGGHVCCGPGPSPSPPAGGLYSAMRDRKIHNDYRRSIVDRSAMRLPAGNPLTEPQPPRAAAVRRETASIPVQGPAPAQLDAEGREKLEDVLRRMFGQI